VIKKFSTAKFYSPDDSTLEAPPDRDEVGLVRAIVVKVRPSNSFKVLIN